MDLHLLKITDRTLATSTASQQAQKDAAI